MSQYFHIANNTKKEYLSDHAFGDAGFNGGHGGIDFGSMISNPFGTLKLLALLLASDVSYGGRPNPNFAGEWQGDNIALYGDWGSEIEYERVCKTYTDITPRLIQSLLKMPFWKAYMESALGSLTPTVERTQSDSTATPTEAKP